MVDAAAVVCGVAYKVAAFSLGVDILAFGDGKWEFGAYPVVETLAVNVAELGRIRPGFLLVRIITYMPESIPLRSTLGVHSVSIIISNAINKRFDVMLEHFAVKSRRLRHCERKA